MGERRTELDSQHWEVAFSFHEISDYWDTMPAVGTTGTASVVSGSRESTSLRICWRPRQL